MSTLVRWEVEDRSSWDVAGKQIARRNLWVSIPNLLCGFAVWMLWSTIIVRIQTLNDADSTLFAFPGADGQPLRGNDYRGLLYLLPAVAGLAGATLRIPNSFIVAISGGRNAKALTTLLLMRFATPQAIRGNLRKQFGVFRNKHNWIMTWLYTMTFGSFIGYSAAFPKLIADVFGYVRVDANGALLAEPMKLAAAPNALTCAFLGALVGSLVRPIGGWLSDRFGGARVTQWDTLVMIGAALGVALCVMKARFSPEPGTWFLPFLLLFLLLFVTTGIGNGSTFRMIPIIFPKEQAGPVLGWTSAIAAYGAFLIPTVFATQIKAGTPEYAMYGFVVYYVSCLLVNWWYYARRGAEIVC